MDKKKLVEIRSGQTGTGLLIESDGYISPDFGGNAQLFESYRNKLNEAGGDGQFLCPSPFIVDAVFQKYGIKNANGRIYPEAVLKREVEKYQKVVSERMALGECNHPDEQIIDLSRVAINIVELHWEGHTLVGKMEVLVSEAFRRNGIICCQGDQVAHLLLNGIKLGVSSRGLGTVTQRMGALIVGDDFDLLCWDVVNQPSTPGAWISDSKDKLQPFIEAKEADETKDKLFEKIEEFGDWLND